MYLGKGIIKIIKNKNSPKTSSSMDFHKIRDLPNRKISYKDNKNKSKESNKKLNKNSKDNNNYCKYQDS